MSNTPQVAAPAGQAAPITSSNVARPAADVLARLGARTISRMDEGALPVREEAPVAPKAPTPGTMSRKMKLGDLRANLSGQECESDPVEESEAPAIKARPVPSQPALSGAALAARMLGGKKGK